MYDNRLQCNRKELLLKGRKYSLTDTQKAEKVYTLMQCAYITQDLNKFNLYYYHDHDSVI